MAQEFITQFHSIEGTPIWERQRNLNRLLGNVSRTPEEKQFILENLKPKTYLEELFYIDVLIHLRETGQLLKIFKEGHGAFVSKIMKQPWFFQEALSNIAPKALVEDLLPSLSYSMKIKLLRSLSYAYNENRIDEIFDYTTNKYGLYIATTFITACSAIKIADILKNYKVKLSTAQLKIIFKKEAKLLGIYLAEQNQYCKGNIFDNNFLSYLAQKDPNYFWELSEKCKINSDLKLGRRTTKKVIPTKTQDIVANPSRYVNHLRRETLVRKLNKLGEFKKFYYNLLPPQIEVLLSGNSVCNELLKYYPKNYQYNLFTSAFREILNDDIWHFSNCITHDLMIVIPDTTVRESWARLKYKESGDEEYLKFYEVKKSVSLTKEKLNTTSNIKTRKKLICLLVKSCAINKDLKTLEEVLHYFCVRHRNDNKSIRTEFLNEIEKNFNLEEFNSIHWKHISEIFTIQSLNGEFEMYNSKLRVKHIEYLFNNGSKSDREYFILEYLKDQLGYGLYFNTLDAIKEVDIVRDILLQSLEHIENLIKTQQKESRDAYYKSQVVGKIFWFNKKYPKSTINVQENKMVVELFKSILNGENSLGYEFELYFYHIICKTNRNEFENELLKFYLQDTSFRHLSFSKALQWFLKYDPMVVVNNFNSFMKTLPYERSSIWRKIKQYNHISLDDIAVKYYADKLRKHEVGNISEFVTPFSVIANPQYYLKIMEDLNIIPSSPKLIIDDEESKKVYDIQKTFLKNFKNFRDPLKYLPLLLSKFCQGDYLKGALPPLYHAFMNVPENELDNHFDGLVKNDAISVKKHSFYLACCVSDQLKVSEIFKKIQENKNESLQKCLFLSSLKYFIKNSKSEHFERTISYMKFLKGLDTESLQILTDSKNIIGIPKDFKSSYIINLWKLLENLKMDEDSVTFGTLMSTVLENINADSISNLPEDFCRGIIKKYFLSSLEDGDDKVPSVFHFVFKYLMYRNNRTDNFTYIFGLVSDYKFRVWNSKGKQRNTIKSFFNIFFPLICNKEANLDFVNQFSEQWNKTFTPTDTFREYVLLNLLIFKKETQNDFQIYSQRVVLFSEQINDIYGEFIFSKIIPILDEFFNYAKIDKKRSEILTNMLKFKTSVVNCMLVIELIAMKGGLFCQNRIKPRYREIYSILNEIKNPKVELCYNLLLKNEE